MKTSEPKAQQLATAALTWISAGERYRISKRLYCRQSMGVIALIVCLLVVNAGQPSCSSRRIRRRLVSARSFSRWLVLCKVLLLVLLTFVERRRLTAAAGSSAVWPSEVSTPRSAIQEKSGLGYSGSGSSSSSGSRVEFCGFCGGKHPSTQCVGVQGSCNLCGQYGHFARVCPLSGSQHTAAPP
ncbi:hypothetical protein F511_11550 [Dorcoceras hygrometricum]|uniref:CCHC-type domain-containing protein n=1 Tax=Dorcoceras hygrometricum TaxID=472368 RepID=A0A2Z7CUX5_9LAMI|nr:hypothetical protein F511_11550 [Dorcoceras hygrometricum]